MTKYVDLDVSQKTTVLCIVDGEGHRLWRGECTSSPDQIVHTVLQHAGAGASIGVETGPMTHTGGESPRTINPPTSPQPKPNTESRNPVRPKIRISMAVPLTSG